MNAAIEAASTVTIEEMSMNNDMANVPAAFSDIQYNPVRLNLTAMDALSDVVPPLVNGVSAVFGTSWMIVSIVLVVTTQNASYPNSMTAAQTWSGIGYIT